MHSEQTEAYLRRIGVERPSSPSARALRELHEAHLRSVPFENLSIHLGEEILLSEEALVAKVVDARRARGLCYELNGAFAALLAALGFDVTLLQARVHGEAAARHPLRPPGAAPVRAEDGGDWLADVGFGAHSQLPLRFDERAGQPTRPVRSAWWRHPRATWTYSMTAARGTSWKAVLASWPTSRPAPGRTGRHRSPLSRGLVCSILTDSGRLTLSGRALTTTADGERHVTELASEAEVLAAYERHFGIVLEREPVPGRTA
ncbi:Arylamine N-acetyltransferase OS=Streptomyces alboniger OX=132473 GN=CP975_01480 PE=3 SV=1 [Streptomyces alboniger]